MSDVMKRLLMIEEDFKDQLEDDESRYSYYIKLDDADFLISTIKQLHAENECYKKALEKISERKMSQYITKDSMINDLSDTASFALEQAAIYKGEQS